MICMNIGKIKIIFEFGFFMYTALLLLADNAGVAAVVLSACAVHEIGHIMSAILFDVKIQSVRFSFGGIKMKSEGKLNGLCKDILILISGPAVNFAAAFFYYMSEMYMPFSVNLILGLFNLMPFTNLDGGAMLKSILEYFEVNVRFIMKITAIISLFFIIGILFLCDIENFMVYAVIIFLAVCELIY